MERPSENELNALLGEERYHAFCDLSRRIDELYDVDRTWDKGFGDWLYEYKYRRGGKTLCTFYMKPSSVYLLVTLGKAEREKTEAQRENFSSALYTLYENTHTYHDGKWLWLEIGQGLFEEDCIKLIKIKRRPNRK